MSEEKKEDYKDTQIKPNIKQRPINTPAETLRELDKKDLECLEIVKKKFGSELDKLYPYVLRTFITGYAHTEDRNKETIERLEHYFKRYKDFKFDTILDEPLKNEEAMIKAWPIYLYGYDKQGHPVLYDEIGSCNTKEVEKVFQNDIELLRTYRYRFHRRMANCKRIQSEKYNTMIYKHVMVMDLAGFTAGHFGSAYRTIIQEIIGDEQNVFPETLFKLFVINANWVFRGIWRILGTFIDPITYQKISVLGGSYTEDMLKFIDIDQIPPKYKGKGTFQIKLGYCSDLPHDRYPLDYYEKKNANIDNKDNDDNTYDDENENNNNDNDDEKQE